MSNSYSTLLSFVYISLRIILFSVNTTSNERILTTISPYLKEKLVQMSDKFGCSQAEVVRIALMKLWEEEK